MTGPLLRDLKGNTELLILAEYLRNPSVKRKEIAEHLGVTEQAVSQYVADLEKSSLLSSWKGHVKPTRKGVQLLQEKLLQLNEEIKAILRQVQVIDSCVAVAGKAIGEKQRVGLKMVGGRLVAVPGEKSTSTGIARSDAREGEELLVGNLEGVVEFSLGELLVLQIPSESFGGSRMMDIRLAKESLKGFKWNEIAAGDLAGEVAAKRVGLEPTMVFAPVEASMTALSKGLNVVFVGSRDSAEAILSEIERMKSQSGYSISFRVVNVGREP